MSVSLPIGPVGTIFFANPFFCMRAEKDILGKTLPVALNIFVIVNRLGLLVPAECTAVRQEIGEVTGDRVNRVVGIVVTGVEEKAHPELPQIGHALHGLRPITSPSQRR